MAKDLKQLIKDKKAKQVVAVQTTSEGVYLALNGNTGETLGLGGTINDALDNLYEFLVYLKRREYPEMDPLTVIQTKSWGRFDLKIVKEEQPSQLNFTFTPED